MSGMDIDDLKDRLGITVYAQDAWYFDDVICEKTLKEHFHCGTLEGLGIGDYDCGMVAAGALLQYLKETQKTSLAHMSRLTPYTTGKYMLLDSSTRRNLELCETLREKQIRQRLQWAREICENTLSSL